MIESGYVARVICGAMSMVIKLVEIQKRSIVSGLEPLLTPTKKCEIQEITVA